MVGWMGYAAISTEVKKNGEGCKINKRNVEMSNELLHLEKLKKTRDVLNF